MLSIVCRDGIGNVESLEEAYEFKSERCEVKSLAIYLENGSVVEQG